MLLPSPAEEEETPEPAGRIEAPPPPPRPERPDPAEILDAVAQRLPREPPFLPSGTRRPVPPQFDHRRGPPGAPGAGQRLGPPRTSRPERRGRPQHPPEVSRAVQAGVDAMLELDQEEIRAQLDRLAQVIPDGHRPPEFAAMEGMLGMFDRLGDRSPREMIRELRESDDPEAAVMLGVLLYQGGRYRPSPGWFNPCRLLLSKTGPH